MARLFAQIFQHTDFRGEYRFLRDDICNFSDQLGFNNRTSSIIVYKGNDYQDGDVIRFYQKDNFGGGFIELGPGRYADIHASPYSFGNKITSADFHPAAPLAPGLGVRLMVRVYQEPNYAGPFRDLLLSERDFRNIGFNDRVSSLRILRGEDYKQGYVANFFSHSEFRGEMLMPGNFGPGTAIPDVDAAPFCFNDRISSMRIDRLT